MKTSEDYYNLAEQWYNIGKGHAANGDRREMIKAKIEAFLCLHKAREGIDG
jgi:hypothetical protein